MHLYETIWPALGLRICGPHNCTYSLQMLLLKSHKLWLHEPIAMEALSIMWKNWSRPSPISFCELRNLCSWTQLYHSAIGESWNSFSPWDSFYQEAKYNLIGMVMATYKSTQLRQPRQPKLPHSFQNLSRDCHPWERIR